MQHRLHTISGFFKSNIFLFAFFFVGNFSIIKAQIYEPEGLNLPGQWNSFTNPPAAASVFGSYSQASGTVHPITVGARRWQTRIHIAPSGADTSAGTYNFLFTSGPVASPYSNKWAGVNVIIDSLQSYQFNSGNDNSITVTNNNVYTMNWEDIGYQSSRAIFMKTSNEPVTLLSHTASPSGNTITPQTPVDLSLTLSGNPSPEEKFYVRYSTNFFASSSIIPVTVVGSTGTATIPGFAAGLSVTYYFFSTTINNPTANYDLVTLDFLNDDGFNFIYNVVDPFSQFGLGDDTYFCPGAVHDTLQTAGNFDTYLWSTGESSPSIIIDEPGLYWLEVSLNEQSVRDTLLVHEINLGTFDLGTTAAICGGAPLEIYPGIKITPLGDSLTIVYDATQGQSGLSGANSVYMHSSFEYVPLGGPVNPWVGNWGVNDGLGEMTNIGQDLWSITINVYDYYGINSDSSVNGLFMVFRNATGTATGKDENGNDIFLGLYQNPPYSPFTGVTASIQTSGYDEILWSTGESTSSITVTTPGTYWVSMSSQWGCSVNDTVVVITSPNPILNLGPDKTSCNNQSVFIVSTGGFASYLWSNGATTQTLTTAVAGTYELTVTNAAGCSASDQLIVTENISPSASFTTQQNGLTVNITNASTLSANYAWDFQNNGSVDNNTAGDVSFTYPSPGQYIIRLIVSNACGADTAYTTVNVTNVGIEKNISNKPTILFPNPTSGNFQFYSEVQIDHLIIRTSTGAIVTEKKFIQAGTITLDDLVGKSQGVYLIEISNQFGTHFSRIQLVQE